MGDKETIVTESVSKFPDQEYVTGAPPFKTYFIVRLVIGREPLFFSETSTGVDEPWMTKGPGLTNELSKTSLVYIVDT